MPMPEASTRTAALLTGQVNFVEAPSPDAIPRLKSAGMQIVTNVYPHNWPYILNFVRGPMTDIRVRRAANYALNRGEFVELLGGLAIEDYATMPPSLALLRPPGQVRIQPEQGEGAAEGGRLPAVQGHARDLHLGLRPDAAAADERAGEVAARGGRLPGRVQGDGLELADRDRPLRRREVSRDRRLQRLARRCSIRSAR